MSTLSMKKQPTAAAVVESSAVVLSDAMQSFFPSITFRLTVRIYSGEIIIAVKEEKNDGLQRSLTRIKKLMSSSNNASSLYIICMDDGGTHSQKHAKTSSHQIVVRKILAKNLRCWTLVSSKRNYWYLEIMTKSPSYQQYQ